MDIKLIPVKSFAILAMAASAGVFVSGCKSKNDPDYSGGSVQEDRIGTASGQDTVFGGSFIGPVASDWGFNPGAGLYIFDRKGMGGTGLEASDSDSSAADNLKPIGSGQGP